MTVLSRLLASSSASSSYSSYSSSYSSSYDPCDDSHRRLAGGGDDGCGGGHTLTLFDFAFESRSNFVVYSFAVVIVFTIFAELVLENLEEAVSAVYHKVLQKIYKELMLLGLISFGLFLAQSSVDVDVYLTHSFEYAHFVMLFVGVLLCIQTSWTCFSNVQIKKQVWIACNADWESALKPVYEKFHQSLLWSLSTTHNAIQLQLFKLCFHEVFDLPRDFSFPHYFCMSLDSHTVELVDVLPSSYGAVLAVIVVSEMAVRFQGPSDLALDWWRVSPGVSVYLFLGLGLAITAAYAYLYHVTSRALMNILTVKFGCEDYRFMGRALERRLEADASRTGKYAARRDLRAVENELRPFLDKAYFEGVETVEKAEELKMINRPSEEGVGPSSRAGSVELSSVSTRVSIEPPPSELHSGGGEQQPKTLHYSPSTLAQEKAKLDHGDDDPRLFAARTSSTRFSFLSNTMALFGGGRRATTTTTTAASGGGGGAAEGVDGVGRGNSPEEGARGSISRPSPLVKVLSASHGMDFPSEMGSGSEHRLSHPLDAASSSSHIGGGFAPDSLRNALDATAAAATSKNNPTTRRTSGVAAANDLLRQKATFLTSEFEEESEEEEEKALDDTSGHKHPAPSGHPTGRTGGGGAGGGRRRGESAAKQRNREAVARARMFRVSSLPSLDVRPLAGTPASRKQKQPRAAAAGAQLAAGCEEEVEEDGEDGSAAERTAASKGRRQPRPPTGGVTTATTAARRRRRGSATRSWGRTQGLLSGVSGFLRATRSDSTLPLPFAQNNNRSQQQGVMSVTENELRSSSPLRSSSTGSSSGNGTSSSASSSSASFRSRSDTSKHMGAARMFGHAGSHNTKVHRNSLVKRKLDTAHLEADAVIECIREALPLGSMALLRRSVDGVRFFAAFYLALWTTTFLPLAWTPLDEFAMDIGPGARTLALLCCVPVVAANLTVEPYLSFQYAIISTISVVNPLLVGETLSFVREQTKMMDHIAFQVLKRYMNLTDLEADSEQEGEEAEAGDLVKMRELLASVFEDWDLHQVGYIDKPTFVHVMHSLGLHLTTNQMSAVFRAIDPDLNGKIVFEEFWAILAGPLSRAVEMLRAHFATAVVVVEEDSPPGSAGLGADQGALGPSSTASGQRHRGSSLLKVFPSTDAESEAESVSSSKLEVNGEEEGEEEGEKQERVLSSSSAVPFHESMLNDGGDAAAEKHGASSHNRRGAQQQARSTAPLGSISPLPMDPSTTHRKRASSSTGAEQQPPSSPHSARQSLHPRQRLNPDGSPLVVLSPSGSGRTLVAVGSFATVDDFFHHMTPLTAGGAIGTRF